MAKAVASIRTVEKLVVQSVPVYDGVTLELTGPEADALALILSKVGGDPDVSARGHAASMIQALQKAGYHYTKWSHMERERISKGEVFFNTHIPSKE